MDQQKIKVIVVDDQNVARGFFEMHIRTSIRYDLVRSLPAAELAVTYCDQNPVDLVIMDVMMRYGMDGLEAAEIIKKNHPKIRIILVTSMAEASWEQRARQIGVDSFWYKETEEVPLLSLLTRTMAGERIYPDRTPAVTVGEASSTELTPAELAVLRELTTGATNREISEKLHISVMTVNSHVQNMLQKTGYKNRVQLAVKARLEGIVIPEG